MRIIKLICGGSKVKKKIIVSVLLLLFISSTSLGYYKQETLEQYLAYRIKYIHSVAENTDLNLDRQRVKEYVEAIIYWGDYYSRQLEVDLDPLLITAILETETNFVSRGDYDKGKKMGIARLEVERAKWIADQLNLTYNKWRLLDATDFGIRFTVYYLGLACKTYNNDLHKAVYAYDLGLNNVNLHNKDRLTSQYLFKVLGRYKYYQNKLNSTPEGEDYFQYLFKKLY